MIARLPLLFAFAFCAACIGAPLAAMLLEAVTGPDGFTLAAFGDLLSDPGDRKQLLLSLALGGAATAIALVLGGGHAWLTIGTDLPFARVLGPLGVAPLVVPPIFVAMGFADLGDPTGFVGCAALLGVSYAPFVAVLTARGLRSIDGRMYEAALLARGRGAAARMLLRLSWPEIAAGCLFAFVFVISEHGVPEFLTVKGKAWHTYAEGVFSKWTLRATGMTQEALVSPIVAAVPLVLLVGLGLACALHLRASRTLPGDFRPLPVRALRGWRWPALLLPLVNLGAGVGVPVVVFARWSSGSTVANQPMSIATARDSFRLALTEASGDLVYTVGIALATAALTLLVALPLGRLAARRARSVDWLVALPVAVPAILLAIGFVKVFNSAPASAVYASTFDFYDSAGVVIAAYAARFLPFAVLPLSAALRRVPRELEEAASLTRRSAAARALRVHLPLALPTALSAAYLVFVLAARELDVAVVLPAGNGTIVRRLSNVVHFGGEDIGGALALLLLATCLLVPLCVIAVTGRRPRSLS